MSYKQRISQISKQLRGSSRSGALLLSSAASSLKSRDSDFRYHPSANLFYLTGCSSPDFCLLISSKRNRPLLITRKPSAERILWEGPAEDPKQIARACGAELIFSEDHQKDLHKELAGIEVLYYDNAPGGVSRMVADKIAAIPSHRRTGLPQVLAHSDIILEPMRLIKDREEIIEIKKAIDVTFNALDFTMPYIRPGISEYDVANLIDYGIRSQRHDTSFDTIVAAGPSAAILHYDPILLERRRFQKTRMLKKNDLVVIDCGAAVSGYAGDVTRTLPANGLFLGLNLELYSIVLAANLAAIKTVRHGVKIKQVYDAAAKVILQGLKDLGVLKGSIPDLLRKGKHKPYFPHGIGHSLGLDVHDLSNHRGNNEAVLTEGMVFTIEPGLYFSKKTGNIPACGLRIEDDVLVTRRGCQVLTGEIPKAPEDIEAWMSDTNN